MHSIKPNNTYFYIMLHIAPNGDLRSIYIDENIWILENLVNCH